MKLEIIKINIDMTIYPRNVLNEMTVARLQAALKTGAKFPPLLIEVKTHRLVDGRHRLEAYKRENVLRADVIEKRYANEADLFADAVRSNIAHGEPLDQFTIRASIIRLEEYGYTRERVSEVVRLPVEAIEKIERGFAKTETGKPLALKGGLNHLAGATLDAAQQEFNRHYSGGKAVFHARQLREMLERDVAPGTAAFVTEMNLLCELWMKLQKKSAAA